MEIFFATFKSVAILMGIGLIGFTILARKTVPLDVLKVLTPLVIEVALPCMIFSSIYNGFDPVAMPDWWSLPLWWIGMIAVFLVLTLLGMQVVDRKNRGEVGISLLFPNATFFPLGIIPIIYGIDSPLLVQLFLFTLLMPILVFNGYSFFFRKTTLRFNLKDSKIINPILVATALAVSLKLTHLDVIIPGFVITITEIVGATALPLIMLTIGGNVYIDYTRSGRFAIGANLRFVLTKNLVFPLITLGLLLLIKPPLPVATLIILQSAVPPLSAVPVLTERANGNTSIANQFLISSFVFSIATIPVILWLFHTLFQ
jgi:malate permease and related proteins